MKDVVRLLGGALFLGLAALTAFPASHQILWKASVAATEWGYWLAIAAVLPMIPTREQTKIGKMGAVLSMGAIGLFIMPVVRASELSSTLPGVFDERFGSGRRVRAHMAEDPRPEPLVLPELLRPVAASSDPLRGARLQHIREREADAGHLSPGVRAQAAAWRDRRARRSVAVGQQQRVRCAQRLPRRARLRRRRHQLQAGAALAVPGGAR